MTTDSSPFCSADDTNVLNGKNCKEQVLVGAVVPVLIHCEKSLNSWGARVVVSRYLCTNSNVKSGTANRENC